MTQSDAIAAIALSMADHNQASILRALHRAYSAGFEAGATAANENHLRIQGLIEKLVTP